MNYSDEDFLPTWNSLGQVSLKFRLYPPSNIRANRP